MANQYCTFRLGGHLFGVPVETVQEVLRQQELTKVPLSSPEVRGLINLRGQIVVTVDLRCRIGLPERAGDTPVTNVVVRTSEGATSLLVDEIGDVLEPEHDVAAIGSGGNFALAAARPFFYSNSRAILRLGLGSYCAQAVVTKSQPGERQGRRLLLCQRSFAYSQTKSQKVTQQEFVHES